MTEREKLIKLINKKQTYGVVSIESQMDDDLVIIPHRWMAPLQK